MFNCVVLAIGTFRNTKLVYIDKLLVSYSVFEKITNYNICPK